MSDTTLRAFPSDVYEALAMLYVQQQDISSVTPEELYELYIAAKEKIIAQQKKHVAEKKASKEPYRGLFT